MPARAENRCLLLIAATVAALSGRGCEDPVVTESLPRMTMGRKRIEYGGVPAGQSFSKNVVIQNVGPGRLSLAVTVEDDPAGAFEVSSFDEVIPPFDRGEAQITFRPPNIDRYTGRLVLTSNDREQPRTEVALFGTGYRRGAIEVEPLLVDFGTVDAGQSSLGQVSVRNAGNGDLMVTGIELDPDTHPDYRIQSSTRTPASVEEGTSVTLLLAYRPGLGSAPPGEGRLIIRAADPFQPETRVRLVAQLNQAPVADAGADQQVEPFDTVALDGSASTDPDGDLPLTFAWHLVRKPEGSSSELLGAERVDPSFEPDLVGVYEAELYVTDATDLRSLLPDRATVTALPAEKLLAELVWDSPIADLDLHLLAPGGAFGSALDCHWDNRTPDWGQPDDASDDPALRRDDLAGFGPETVGYGAPIDGVYKLVVDFYAAHTPSGKENTTATLRVFIDGFLQAEVSRRLSAQGQRWTAVQVRWPEGRVEEVDQMNQTGAIR